MKLTIARFHCITGDYDIEQRIDWFAQNDTNYARISEYVEVDFPDRAQAEVVTEQLSGLEVLEKQVEDDYASKISAIRQKRRELEALTYQPSCTDSIDVEVSP